MNRVVREMVPAEEVPSVQLATITRDVFAYTYECGICSVIGGPWVFDPKSQRRTVNNYSYTLFRPAEAGLGRHG